VVYMTFGSTHGAFRAEKLLASRGIPSRVVPKPVQIPGPCGTAVVVADDVLDAALGALRELRVPPRQVLRASEAAGSRSS
jgi:hypothetical protein